MLELLSGQWLCQCAYKLSNKHLVYIDNFGGPCNYFPGSWDGWEVDVGGGQWVEDTSLVTACHVGDEAATTNYPPISTTSDQV